MRYDVLSMWTDAGITDIEDMLARSLDGEFVGESDGTRFLLFGDVPGEVTVRRPRHMSPGRPSLLLFIDDRDENRSIDVQQNIALQVFDTLSEITSAHLELRAEDDTIIRDRPAKKAA